MQPCWDATAPTAWARTSPGGSFSTHLGARSTSSLCRWRASPSQQVAEGLIGGCAKPQTDLTCGIEHTTNVGLGPLVRSGARRVGRVGREDFNGRHLRGRVEPGQYLASSHTDRAAGTVASRQHPREAVPTPIASFVVAVLPAAAPRYTTNRGRTRPLRASLPPQGPAQPTSPARCGPSHSSVRTPGPGQCNFGVDRRRGVFRPAGGRDLGRCEGEAQLPARGGALVPDQIEAFSS